MEITTVKSVLQHSDVFRECTENQLQELLLLATPKCFAEQDTVYTRGDPTNNTFCLIISGSVHIIDDHTGFVAVRGTGEVIGELALFVPQHQRTFTVVAVETVEVLEWDIQRLNSSSLQRSHSLLPLLKERLFTLVHKRLPPGTVPEETS